MGAGNGKQEPRLAQQSPSYHYPPCPRQRLPVRWKLPGRGTRHRPPAPSRSPAGPPRSWAGRGRAAAVSRDLPACPAAPIPPTLSCPPPSSPSAALAPSQFSSNTNTGEFFFCFSVPNSLQRVLRDYVHAAQKITQTSQGRKKAASTTVWRGKRCSPRAGIRPPARAGSARGC